VAELSLSGIYDVNGEDWYKLYPYTFAIEGNKGSSLKYALPIPPESLVVQMIAPTEVVPTLGGVVEEPSAVVFWSIQLAGSMGIAPSKFKLDNKGDVTVPLGEMAQMFRGNLAKTGLISGMADSLFKPADAVAKTWDAFTNGGTAGGIQAINQPFLPYAESQVNGISNGYTEIHNFHKFFILYTKLNSRKDALNDPLVAQFANEKFGLFFYNYKDGQKFRIVLKNFMIIKTQTSPYLYKYQCQFKGWDLSPIARSDKSEYNRFDPATGDLASVNTTSITSTLNAGKKLLRNVKTGVTDPLGTFLSTPPVI
jgi:hypothetical protein